MNDFAYAPARPFACLADPIQCVINNGPLAMTGYEKLLATFRADDVLRAERKAEAARPRCIGRRLDGYRIASPVAPNLRSRLAAPNIQGMAPEAPEPGTEPTPQFHQRLNGSDVARTYSLSHAEWQTGVAMFVGPDVEPVVLNHGKTTEIVCRPGPSVINNAARKPVVQRRGPDIFDHIFADHGPRVAPNMGRGAEIKAAAPQNIGPRGAVPAAAQRVAPFDYVEKVGTVNGFNVWRANGGRGYAIVSKAGSVLAVIDNAASLKSFVQIWGILSQ